MSAARPVGPLVLVVDDEDSARFVKTTVLKRAGFEIREAASGAEALSLLDAYAFEAVLLDINLPDISGIEICRRIKADPSLGRVQVLHISNTAVTPGDQAYGLNAGADGYLTEPVSPEVLIATLRALLRARTAELALADALNRERAARDDAERANRLKDEFLAALSHELRTPLNAIMGWMWQLRRSALTEEQRERALDSVERNTRLQAKLINDLLDVSRIGRGKLELEPEPIDLSAVVAEAVDATRASASQKNLTLIVDAEPAGIVGDPVRLQQVVRNLLANAVQFTPSGGAVSVGVERRGDTAVLRVRDTGVGLEPEFLPYAFDLFRQGQSGLAGRHGGLGLGLALVRQLVEMHGGTVAAESDGPGKGATFTVTLPTSPLVAVRDGEGPVPHLLDGVRLLCVEDDDEARELLTAVLEASGALVTAVPSADAALEALRAASFDLLVSDIGMPVRNGLDLLRAVRAGGHQLPAVAVTAFATAHDRQLVSEAGYALHVAKPVLPAGFVRALATLVRQTS